MEIKVKATGSEILVFVSVPHHFILTLCSTIITWPHTGCHWWRGTLVNNWWNGSSWLDLGCYLARVDPNLCRKLFENLLGPGDSFVDQIWSESIEMDQTSPYVYVYMIYIYYIYIYIYIYIHKRKRLQMHVNIILKVLGISKSFMFRVCFWTFAPQIESIRPYAALPELAAGINFLTTGRHPWDFVPSAWQTKWF